MTRALHEHGFPLPLLAPLAPFVAEEEIYTRWVIPHTTSCGAPAGTVSMGEGIMLSHPRSFPSAGEPARFRLFAGSILAGRPVIRPDHSPETRRKLGQITQRFDALHAIGKLERLPDNRYRLLLDCELSPWMACSLVRGRNESAEEMFALPLAYGVLSPLGCGTLEGNWATAL